MLARRVLGACAFALAVAPASEVAADPPARVLVHLRGPGRVRVEIAEGATAPCDSSANRALFNGWLGPGQTFASTTEESCICVRQTFDNFPNANWSTPQLVCRPRVCRGRFCRPAPNHTIRVTLDSRETHSG